MRVRIRLFGFLIGIAFSSVAVAEQLVPFGPTAFSLADPALNSSDLAKFNYGRGLFHHEWQVHRHANGSQSGLGPIFSANACAACHIRGGRGKTPEKGERPTAYVIAVGIPSALYGTLPDPIYGAQIQSNAVGTPTEAEVFVSYKATLDRLSDGTPVELRTPIFEIGAANYGQLHEHAELSGRLPQQIIGLGYLEQIGFETLSTFADPEDVNGDGISGRISLMENGEIGRFGWKATAPTVLHQTAKAASSDMGISTPLFPAYAGDCTQKQVECLEASLEQPQNKKTELDVNEARILALYSANIHVPPRRNAYDPEVRRGEGIFSAIGCASCHVPVFSESQEYRGAYTDMLLHEMGMGLSDPTYGETELAREWRTPPLWGIGYTEEVNGNQFYLHDGRARDLIEAIMWHGGEAERTKETFRSLSTNERNALIAFLNSL
ncbi:di-heme oxidoredictase family protein [Maritalea porphyrae]|uniref:Thiol oxidoreductase n=1 Tax=Maritalea porphyrae TaxID=880732 RepID=A0ABQ5USV9_9HYPH|nr:di-heme oxidoredictase family protein [Maritalea porphyrae]GLQ18363.1 thiol oxidoreductase [Maritalea porphyrae]